MLKFFNNIRLWGVLLFVLLALIIFLPALLEYHSTKQDLVGLWQEQSRLVAETIVRGSQTLLRFDQQMLLEQRERLLNDGLTLRQLDSLHFPNTQPAQEFSLRRFHSRILFLTPQGRLIGSPRDPFVRRNSRANLRLLKKTIAHFPQDSLLTLVLPDNPKRPRPPFLMIRRAQNRGFMVVFIRPAMGQRMMRFHSFKQWLEEIVKSPGVLYIQLLKDTRPLVEAGDLFLAPAQAPENQSNFEVSWQILKSENQTIFDYWQPAPNNTTIRVGLATTALTHLQQNLVRRLILNSLLLLVIGFLVLRFILNKQNVALLQNRLSQLETYTITILKNMSDGILAFNSAHEIEFTNAAYHRLTGMQSFSGFDQAVSFLPEEIKKKLIAFQEFEDIPFQHEQRFLLLSGKSVRPNTTDNATELLYLLIVRDFTSQKQLDEMRTRRSKLLAMGELASRVAHEIRNPLNGIAMLAQRLQKEFTLTENQQEFEQMASAIRQETERLNQIVHSFLFYARSPQFKFEPLSLDQFLKEIEPILQASGHAPVEFEIRSKAVVEADPDQLKQALINLLQNAQEVSSPDKPITIVLEQKGQNVQLCVEDRGGGIPPEIKDRIFDLYFTTKDDGNGIGLSIVEKIVEAHGGQIYVESPYFKNGQEIQGSRFVIELPLKSQKGSTT